eukprot:3636999-Pleurochrysis_carterae.AAC.1
MRAQLGTEVLAVGETASKRLAAEVKVMFDRDHHRMSAGIGCTKESLKHVHFSADGFPTTGFSLLYACVSNVSVLPRFLSHSEAELSCLLVSRRAENWNQIRRDGAILFHVAAGLTAGANSSTAADLTAADSTVAHAGRNVGVGGKLYLKLSLTADKKNLDAMRGCGPSPAWCACGGPKQYRLPWDFNGSPPTSFNELRSSVCGVVPYPSQELRATARAELERLQKSKSKQEQPTYAEQRQRHAASYFVQQEFGTPVFCFDMADAIPKLLHADSLTVAKLLFKFAILRHADPPSESGLQSSSAGCDTQSI